MKTQNLFGLIKILTPVSLLISINAFSQEPKALEEFYSYFKTGKYTNAIEVLNRLDTKENSLSNKAYLLGLSYSKLQEYDKATKNFAIAISEKNESADLYYEYGQALYATNELKKAREAFKTSAQNKYNSDASLYYVAHISQILEEFQLAKDSYTILLKSTTADEKIKQISRFQLGEVLLSMLRDKFKNNNQELTNNVSKYVLPMMKQAYETDKSTALSQDIDIRYKEIQKEFNLDPNLLLNGKKLNSKRYSGSLSQKIKFDDNITSTNEENNVQASKKESFVFESEAYAKYDFLIQKKYIVSPEARVTFTHHGEQDSSEVFQNDSMIIGLNLKNKYEHIAFNQPASLNFDIDYSNVKKDFNKIHTREQYATSTTFGFGESFSLFSFGDTSFKFKYKNYTAENESLNNHTTSYMADQTIALPSKHLLIALFEIDQTDNYNNKATNTNSYLMRFDYIIPDLLNVYTLSIGLATTLTDTLDQMTTRGYETSINPSIDLSKQINDKLKFSINADYTKSQSKSSDYKYQKTVITTEMRFSF